MGVRRGSRGPRRAGWLAGGGEDLLFARGIESRSFAPAALRMTARARFVIEKEEEKQETTDSLLGVVE
jgi:hypothetical protein